MTQNKLDKLKLIIIRISFKKLLSVKSNVKDKNIIFNKHFLENFVDFLFNKIYEYNRLFLIFFR
jgi:hypothetical protein